ncbi:MAG: fatty acyl-AMP ligase [Acidobacteria bacterium]|nr:fatty acyl-AMP ligase [Acidobacteriota bacterium]
MRFIGFGADEYFFTYRQLYAEARRRAAHLTIHHGLKKGDRLVLMTSEAHEFVMSFLGCVMAGIIPAPVSPPMMAKGGDTLAPAAARIVQNSQASVLLTTESSKPFAEQILERTNGETRLLTMETAFAESAPPFDPPQIQPEDICFLQYTSGSTTLPRGVMVSHGNLMANMRGFMGQRGMYPGPEDVGVSWLPLYHDMGLIGFILGPLVYIGPVVVLSTSSFARDPRLWLKTLHKYRGTITYAPNFAYAQVVKRLRDSDLENLDLSCVRIAGCGAEPIQAATLKSFAERLAPTGFRAEAFLPSYGMAESTLAITLHKPGSPIRTEFINADELKRGKAILATEGNGREFVSCGFPLAEHHLTIVNEHGEPLPDREVGEIVFRGPSVTQGYFQNPDATAATWRDGWLHTGDLGYLADGELFVCGRSKELIIIRGANYYPQDIEWALRDVPGIKRGNVVAFSIQEGADERLVLIAEADAREDAEALRQAIRVKVLESVGLEVFRVVLAPGGTLQRTTSGKLQRRKMKQLFEQGEIAEL